LSDRYTNIWIQSPVWWPIWIGPQAQHEPHEHLDGKCPLNYPVGRQPCPQPSCATFENITLTNILIEDPLLSPGVILGNSSNPMRNIVFENVTVHVPMRNILNHGRLPFHEDFFPFQGRYKCENVVGTCRQCYPAPHCLEIIS